MKYTIQFNSGRHILLEADGYKSNEQGITFHNLDEKELGFGIFVPYNQIEYVANIETKLALGSKIRNNS